VKLSDFELEVMQIMWDKGSMIATEVHEIIAAKRKVSYSTVKTIIDRLEEKGAVRRGRNYGRTILYEPAISREELTPSLFRSFVEKTFKGELRPLFNHALRDEKLTMDDLAYLEQILADKREELSDHD
jgi:BlaI family penicillinase repressor